MILDTLALCSRKCEEINTIIAPSHFLYKETEAQRSKQAIPNKQLFSNDCVFWKSGIQTGREEPLARVSQYLWPLYRLQNLMFFFLSNSDRIF